MILKNSLNKIQNFGKNGILRMNHMIIHQIHEMYLLMMKIVKHIQNLYDNFKNKWRKNNMDEIIYFEVDNWFSGRDYPDIEPINEWVKKDQFNNEEWCKENKLCVVAGPIDMSMCWCVTTSKSWIKKNCPKLLSNKKLKYQLHYSDGTIEKHIYKATDFICKPDENGYVEGKVSSWDFLEYKKENFGVHWNYSYWDNEREDD